MTGISHQAFAIAIVSTVLTCCGCDNNDEEPLVATQGDSARSVYARPAVPEQPGKHEIQDNGHVIFHPAPPGGVMEGFPPPKNNRVTIDNYRAKLEGLVNQNPGAAVANTRWAHFHMRELFPTQRISRGRIPIRPLPVKTVDLSEVRVATSEGNRRSIAEWLGQSYTDAFLVLHNGSIVREEYFHGMRDDTHHHLWSLGKSFVAGVVFHLIAERKLSEDGLITDYVPRCVSTALRHLPVEFSVALSVCR